MNYAIITLFYERGLWYLGESLKRHLEKEGHAVEIILHSKQLEPIVASDFEGRQIHQVNELTAGFLREHEIEMVISTEETDFQRTAFIRRCGVGVADIPMIEQVREDFFMQGGYNIFDEVWCVTDYTYNIFKKFGYGNAVRKEWDFVDRKWFASPPEYAIHENYQFYHPRGWGGQHNRKNTERIIEAFAEVHKLHPGTELLITSQAPIGLNGMELLKHASHEVQTHLPYSYEVRVYEHGIRLINGTISRQMLAQHYRGCNCVLNPAMREGLGLTFYEARACGKPVIALDAPPMNELGDVLVPVSEWTPVKNSLVPLAQCKVENLAEAMLTQVKNWQMVGIS